jgi:hypothetical protein
VPGEREPLRVMLFHPHMKPLTSFASKLRQRGSVEVPKFDPLDGGIRAQALFLFEKPSPMTADGRAPASAGATMMTPRRR